MYPAYSLRGRATTTLAVANRGTKEKAEKEGDELACALHHVPCMVHSSARGGVGGHHESRRGPGRNSRHDTEALFS